MSCTVERRTVASRRPHRCAPCHRIERARHADQQRHAHVTAHVIAHVIAHVTAAMCVIRWSDGCWRLDADDCFYATASAQWVTCDCWQDDITPSAEHQAGGRHLRGRDVAVAWPSRGRLGLGLGLARSRAKLGISIGLCPQEGLGGSPRPSGGGPARRSSGGTTEIHRRFTGDAPPSVSGDVSEIFRRGKASRNFVALIREQARRAPGW